MILIQNIAAVTPGFEAEFEARFKTRAGRVEQAEGFIRFELQRHRAVHFNHGKGFEAVESAETRYTISTWWDRLESFEAWTRSPAFRAAHREPSTPEMFTQPMILNVLDVLE